MLSTTAGADTAPPNPVYDSQSYFNMMDGPVEDQPIGYHWQQGVWFAFPVGYRNPYLREAATEITTDRVRMEEALKRTAQRTGFSQDGRYDRSLISDVEARASFAFHLESLSKVNRNLRFDADITGDPDNPKNEDAVKFSLLWAGGTAPEAPSDITRRFDRYLEARGAPPPLGKGHLTPLGVDGKLPPAGNAPLPLGHSGINYRLYEQHKGVTANLLCIVVVGANGPRVPQPLCDGYIQQAETGVYLYLRFPEHIIRSDQSWFAPVSGALSLVKRWRVD